MVNAVQSIKAARALCTYTKGKLKGHNLILSQVGLRDNFQSMFCKDDDCKDQQKQFHLLSIRNNKLSIKSVFLVSTLHQKSQFHINPLTPFLLLYQHSIDLI